jgi:hypothetical protein
MNILLKKLVLRGITDILISVSLILVFITSVYIFPSLHTRIFGSKACHYDDGGRLDLIFLKHEFVKFYQTNGQYPSIEQAKVMILNAKSTYKILYHYDSNDNFFILVCNGCDKKWGTYDDVIVSSYYQSKIEKEVIEER